MPNLTLFLRGVVPAAAALLAVTACGAADPTTDGAADTTRTVDTAYGAIEVPDDPQRVVAVSYDTPWQLASMEVTPVATQDYSAWLGDFTAEQQEFVAGLDDVGSFGELDLEKVAAAAPDLIVGDVYEIDEKTWRQLNAIAPTAIVEGDHRGDWKSITDELAEVVGAEEQLAEAKREYEEKLDDIRATYADQIGENAWVHFSLGDSESDFSVQYPSGTTGSMMVDELGVTYADSVPPDPENGSGYGSYSIELLGDYFSDVTVAVTFENTDGSPNPLVEAIEQSDVFQSTDVARSGDVYHLAITVTDYATAVDWLEDMESEVLAKL